MDLERKLRILADCDFSKWRKLERAGRDSESIRGFGNMLTTISTVVENIANNLVGEEGIKKIYLCYGMMASDYARVPFEEMDTQDEDFRFFFEYKDMLDKLGKTLTAFIDKCHASGFSCSEKWPEFIHVKSLVDNMGKRNYRSEILGKHGITYSEPAPSN